MVRTLNEEPEALARALSPTLTHGERGPFSQPSASVPRFFVCRIKEVDWLIYKYALYKFSVTILYRYSQSPFSPFIYAYED